MFRVRPALRIACCLVLCLAGIVFLDGCDLGGPYVYVSVPDVLSLSMTNAQLVLEAEGLYLGRISGDYMDINAAIVIGQAYPPGTNVPEGRYVDLVLGENSVWTKVIGSDAWEAAAAVDTTSDGGYVLAGTTDGAGSKNEDMLVVRLDPLGNVKWKKLQGDNGEERAQAIEQTEDTGYIVGGWTTSSGNGYYDFYLVRLNKYGNTTWAKTFGSSFRDYAFDVAQTSDRGFIIAGYAEGVPDGNPGSMYLVKTSAFGNVQWENSYGGDKTDFAYSAQQTSDGGYILAGSTRSFGASGEDVLLVKVDADGEEEWTQTFGASDDDWAHKVLQTSDDGYILCGFTFSGESTGSDILVIKTDADGNEEWTEVYDKSELDGAYDITQADDGGFLITGYQGNLNDSFDDVLLIKIDADGVEEWTVSGGGSELDQALAAVPTLEGGFVVVGLTESFEAVEADIFVKKIDALGNGAADADIISLAK